MFRKLQRICTLQLKNNYIWCILILSGFVCGGIFAAACIFRISDFDQKEICLYFGDFFNNINSSGSDSFEIFKLSVIENMKIYIFIALLSMMVIGSPFVALFSVVIGFSTSFTVLFMFKSYGIKTLLFCLVGLVPHQIILLPCYFITLVLSIRFSVSLLDGKINLKNELPSYLLKMCALFCTSVLSSLLQAYIEPLFIQLVSHVFI